MTARRTKLALVARSVLVATALAALLGIATAAVSTGLLSSHQSRPADTQMYAGGGTYYTNM